MPKPCSLWNQMNTSRILAVSSLTIQGSWMSLNHFCSPWLPVLFHCTVPIMPRVSFIFIIGFTHIIQVIPYVMFFSYLVLVKGFSQFFVFIAIFLGWGTIIISSISAVIPFFSSFLLLPSGWRRPWNLLYRFGISGGFGKTSTSSFTSFPATKRVYNNGLK